MPAQYFFLELWSKIKLIGLALKTKYRCNRLGLSTFIPHKEMIINDKEKGCMCTFKQNQLKLSNSPSLVLKTYCSRVVPLEPSHADITVTATVTRIILSSFNFGGKDDEDEELSLKRGSSLLKLVFTRHCVHSTVPVVVIYFPRVIAPSPIKKTHRRLIIWYKAPVQR